MRKLALAALSVSLTLAACGQQNTPAPQNAVAPVTSDEATASALPVLEGMNTSATSALATEPYNITLRFVGNPSQAFRDAANAAARRWEQAVTGGLPSVTGSFSPQQQCGASAPNFSGTIDDILIDVGVANIDGPGTILAQSGPCLTRSTGGLTIYGSLIFDSADVTAFSSQLAPILIHEMGHSLGIGTLWQSKGVLAGAGSSNPTFTGSRAVTEWRTLGGSGNVPVENTGGAGTRDGHWRETTFKNELMTGFINAGSNPLSRMSIASLGDLGYTVNVGVADAYTVLTAIRAQTEDQLDMGEQLLKPKFQVR
jgi:Leishmanolysin